MDEIRDYARERIEKGSKSFAAAARLFDEATRDSVYLLYSWCRYCDDEIDEQELGFAPRPATTAMAERLAALQTDTAEALKGRAARPEFAGLNRVVKAHAIPHALPHEHLAGFAMDAADTRYRTIDDTLKYCWHVAGAVGVMMAMIMGARERHVLLRASDLGIAFQLTNIARDVMADAAVGRVYLPEDWLGEHGVGTHAVAALEHRAGVHRATVRLLDLADRYYRSSGYGLAMLPPRSSIAIGAARSVYRAIGIRVRRRGVRAWDKRASVGKAGKAGAVASGAAAAVWSRAQALAGPPPPREGLYVPDVLKEA